MLEMNTELTTWSDTVTRDSYRHKIEILDELTELYPDATEADLEILCQENRYDKDKVIQDLESENFYGFWFWDDLVEFELYNRFEQHMSKEVLCPLLPRFLEECGSGTGNCSMN